MRRLLLILLIFLIGVQGEVCAAPLYTLVDLGLFRTLPYTPEDYRDSTKSRDINSSGQVVGSAYHRLDCCNTTDTAFTWSASAGIQGLPDVEARRRHYANAINDQGVVVGYFGSTTGARAVLWDSTGAHDLGPGSAEDINNSGVVLFGDGRVLSGGVVTSVTGLTKTSRINELGQIIGSIAGDVSHGYLWDQGVLTAIGNPAWRNSGVTDLSDTGYVVGSYAYAYQLVCNCDFGDYTYHEVVSEVHAFSSRAGAWTDLGPGFAKAVNNRGEVVGVDWLSRQPVYFDPVLGPVPLHTLVSNLGALRSLTDVVGINDSGQIIGYGAVGLSGEYHAFVLTPVPLPGALPMLATAFIALVPYRRRARAALGAG